MKHCSIHLMAHVPLLQPDYTCLAAVSRIISDFKSYFIHQLAWVLSVSSVQPVRTSHALCPKRVCWPACQQSEGGVFASSCVCLAVLCTAVPLPTVWNLADKETVSLTHCAATMLGLRRAIKMVAMLLLSGLAGQTGSQGGSQTGICCGQHIRLAVSGWRQRSVVDVLHTSPVMCVLWMKLHRLSLCVVPTSLHHILVSLLSCGACSCYSRS